jgi:hypothetical protein
MAAAHLSTQPAARAAEQPQHGAAQEEDLFGGLNVAHEASTPAHDASDSLI